MSDAVLQILLLLAYLAIGLISVTFPIYAISVTYLRQEKSETEKERKKRISILKSKISKLMAELGENRLDSKRIDLLKEQIERYVTEKEGIELKVGYLTARGAVMNPVIFLVLALLTAGVGIHFFYEEIHGFEQALGYVAFFGFFSCAFIFAALTNLYRTISAVEYAALRPARTVEFDVSLLDEKRNPLEKLKLKKETLVYLEVEPLGDSVENLIIIADFPQEFKSEETALEEEASGFSIRQFRDCTIVCWSNDFVPKDCITGGCFPITAVNIGEFSVKLIIYAKGIYNYEMVLTLKVVK